MNELRPESAQGMSTTPGQDRHGVAVGSPNRPTNFVAAALPDRAGYEQAIQALVRAGIDRARLAILHGDRGAEAIADGRRRSRSWFDMSDEERYVERFERAARAGAWVIGVDLRDASAETRDLVRMIVAESGGEGIVSRSRWTHEVQP